MRIALALGFAGLSIGPGAVARDAPPKPPSARQRTATPVPARLPPPRPAALTPKPVAPAPKAQPAANPAPKGPDGPSAPSTCVRAFEESGGVVLRSPGDPGTGDCAIEDPVTFQRLTSPDGAEVVLDSAITVRCSFALAVQDWVGNDLSAIAKREQMTLAKLISVGGHACRGRNGAPGAPISEHASGNALDVGGLRMKDGRTLDLTSKDVALRPMREAVRKSACERFTTVLGPGADSSHKDHLHLDMRQRPRGFRICQWTVD